MKNFNEYKQKCHKYSKKVENLFDKMFIFIPINYRYKFFFCYFIFSSHWRWCCICNPLKYNEKNSEEIQVLLN